MSQPAALASATSRSRRLRRQVKTPWAEAAVGRTRPTTNIEHVGGLKIDLGVSSYPGQVMNLVPMEEVDPSAEHCERAFDRHVVVLGDGIEGRHDVTSELRRVRHFGPKDPSPQQTRSEAQQRRHWPP